MPKRSASFLVCVFPSFVSDSVSVTKLKNEVCARKLKVPLSNSGHDARARSRSTWNLEPTVFDRNNWLVLPCPWASQIELRTSRRQQADPRKRRRIREKPEKAARQKKPVAKQSLSCHQASFSVRTRQASREALTGIPSPRTFSLTCQKNFQKNFPARAPSIMSRGRLLVGSCLTL